MFRPRAAAAAVALSLITGCTQTVIQRGAPPTTRGPVDIDSSAPETIGCEVAPLLIPTCGAWFGVSSPSADGRYDYVRGLAEYESLINERPDILHFYERGGEPFPTPEHIALAEPANGQPPSILHFAWKPSTDMSWRRIAAGEADEGIDRVASALSAYERQLFLTIYHEPENDVVADSAAGMTTDDYVDMYRHVVGRLRSAGVDNVVYVMNYMGFERWAPIVDALYPGDDVVDWIAYDPYAFERHATFADMLNDPNDAGWPGFYEWATAKRPGTPIMLAEWGFDLATNSRAAEMVREAPDTLRTQFPAVKALVYWNDRAGLIDARLSGDAAHASEFADALNEVASHEYFSMTPTPGTP